MNVIKVLLLILGAYVLAAWNDARADVFASTPNKNNGEIILYDQPGKCPKGQLMMISRGGNGTTLFGCWLLAEDLIFVRYTDGDVRTYDAAAFRLGPTYRKDQPKQGTSL